jgi:hypothetical protein
MIMTLHEPYHGFRNSGGEKVWKQNNPPINDIINGGEARFDSYDILYLCVSIICIVLLLFYGF